MATPKAVKGGVNDIKSLTQFVFKNLDELFYKLSFEPNDRSKAGNFDAEQISFTTTGTQQKFPHKLERVPVGIIVVDKDNFCDIKTIAKDTTSITVTGSVSGVAIKMIII